METPIKMDDLGPTPTFGNTHVQLLHQFHCLDQLRTLNPYLQNIQHGAPKSQEAAQQEAAVKVGIQPFKTWGKMMGQLSRRGKLEDGIGQ